jgi:signal transduction histidine kinase
MNQSYARLRLSERALAQLNEQLESRVEERTRALTTANEGLRGAVEAREAAEERVAQLQRLEAVGQLTGGIAHDFNNMLGIIIGNLDLAERKINRGSTDIVRRLHGALEGAKRGASLTQRLLALARRQPLNPVVSDINGLVSAKSELLRRTLGEHIEVECVLAEGLWHTFIDPGQLESALVNLAVNARDAMPQGGRLTVETGITVLDREYANDNPDAIPGDYVVVAVSDTGSGMTPDVVSHASSPSSRPRKSAVAPASA